MKGHNRTKGPELVFHKQVTLTDLNNDPLIDTIAKRYFQQKIKQEIRRGGE